MRELTYEAFERCMLMVKEDNQYMARAYDMGFTGLSERLHSETMLIVLLRDLLDDTDDLISWWCYEKDFGQRDDLKITDKDDKEIPSTTIRDLWNLLTGDSGDEITKTDETEDTEEEQAGEPDEEEK